MSNELEKRFSSYLKKTLKGYSNKQKIKYHNIKNAESTLSEESISKASYYNYLEKNNELDDLDIDYYHLEKIFTNPNHYLAMKKVPLKQRQILYLLIIEEYTTKEVASYFNTTTDNINKLKQQAIKNFKRNLEKLNEK